MKILSKYKEYYDYLMGIYGQDPLKVLDRTAYKTYDVDLVVKYPRHKAPDEIVVRDFIIYFCGDYYFLGDVKNLRKGDERKGLFRKLDKDKVDWVYEVNNKVLDAYYDTDLIYEDDLFCVLRLTEDSLKKRYKDYLKIKDEITAPYYIVRNYDKTDEVFMPNLTKLNFAKFLSAEDCYLAIENYISKKDVDMPNSPNDMIRFEQKGFKKGKSFITNKNNWNYYGDAKRTKSRFKK